MDNRNHITNELARPDAALVECRECGSGFTLSPEEQSWYAEKGFDLPARCPACRKKRRALRNAYNKGRKHARLEAAAEKEAQ